LEAQRPPQHRGRDGAVHDRHEERLILKGFALSSFGSRYSGGTGISELMADLSPGAGGPSLCMLGGGNPAVIPEVAAVWESRWRSLLGDRERLALLLGAYDSHLGRESFRKALAEAFRERYGWDVSERNVAVVNGSQIASYYLLNMFSGEFPDGSRRRILLPVVPEYIGYADQGLDPACFAGMKPSLEITGPRRFKYRVDFASLADRVDRADGIGAICASRPTNPTGNVLTGDEIERLSAMAEERGIPLILDNAYGLPFPGIVFRDVEPFWNRNVILALSLSKIGLPALRTGIVVAGEEIVEALSAANAIVSLATGSIGPAVVEPLVRSGELFRISREVVRPYYEEKSERVLRLLERELEGLPWAAHENEGTFFLWLWFKDLPVPSKELYRRLKAREVIVVPGEYFFFGLEGDWPHSRECLRLNYSAPEECVARGIAILGEELRKLYG
jgi:valine--pyruvate aminotransferase